MNKKQMISFVVAASLLPLSACVTDPETGNRTISKAAIGGLGGALGGYLLGDLIGGRRDRTEKIVGAGIGAVAGAGVGSASVSADSGVDSPRDLPPALLLPLPVPLRLRPRRSAPWREPSAPGRRRPPTPSAASSPLAASPNCNVKRTLGSKNTLSASNGM